MDKTLLVLATVDGNLSGILAAAVDAGTGKDFRGAGPEAGFAIVRAGTSAQEAIAAAKAAGTVLVVDASFDGGKLAALLPGIDFPSVFLYDPAADAALMAACGTSPLVQLLPSAGADASGVFIAARNALAVSKALLAANEQGRIYGTRFRTLLAALPDIVYVLDEEGHFAYLNDAVKGLGYEPSELIGRLFSEILHPDDRDKVSRREVIGRIRSGELAAPTPPKLFDERRSGDRMTRDLEVRLLPKNGADPMYGSVNAYGENDPEPVVSGAPRHHGPVTMGVVRDVTADRAYRKSLEENLAAKELLLREIHHRVKNNLQVIASLAHLREMDMEDENAKSAMRAMSTEVRSMAMAHEALYQSENLEGVRADEYFGRFGRFLEQSYSLLGRPIRLDVEADDSVVGVEILSNLALIANELVSNAYKHAFPEGREGAVRLRFACSDANCELEVSDNGVGASGARGDGSKGLGLEIVEALARRMGGSLERNSAGGTSVLLRFPRGIS